jgi:pyruvate,orthophosphate dikinase
MAGAPIEEGKSMTDKFVYKFAPNDSEGNASMKSLLGGKGANLAEMCAMGIPVPPGFTISTEVCTWFYANGRTYPQGLTDQVDEALAFLEMKMGARFGSSEPPLLLSVRSGARASMPGMMDTVLNLGLNDAAVEGLIRNTGDKRFAYDAYRRFVQMYGDVVMDVKPELDTDPDPFEHELETLKKARGVKTDVELSWEDLKGLVARFKAIVLERTGRAFPDDPKEQLWGSIGAVFSSWMNDRAIVYRKMNDIPAEWGTAVNVQCMVFGNLGLDCATGVGFTRDSATGERRKNGEFLINAQGEDVVAGTRTPQQLTLADSRRWAQDHGISEETRKKSFPSLEEYMPENFKELMGFYDQLEKHYRDMQDVEFTIQRHKLFMLQTRNGKRTGFAAARIAVDMVDEGLITPKEALLRIEPDHLEHLLKPIFDADSLRKAVADKLVVARGLAAGPGAATGRIAFTAARAEALASQGKDPVLLVRHETSPEDIRGMKVSEGILTARGGMTSHAAVVARQMGKVCIVGCGELEIDYKAGVMQVKGETFREGDWMSLNGFTGQIIRGQVKTKPSTVQQGVMDERTPTDREDIFYHFSRIMEWSDEYRTLGIRTNADEPEQAAIARKFGARGIGLCRTEHMFFKGQRILAVREMILAETLEEREKALAKLLPMQKGDFKGIFKAMDGLPVTIRTLDPPLHEFLPHEESQIQEMAKEMGVDPGRVKLKVKQLTESNPMLGHRGCRLGIVYPEITAMQARAILEAAVECQKEGISVFPEIMVPLVGHVNELKAQKEIIVRVAEEVFSAHGTRVNYLVGTMIELPRAALTADQIAREAEFFSFGTNDLTQTTFGMSRDDAGVFLGYYQEHKLLEYDPFQTLDQDGVGQLVVLAAEKSRPVRPGIKLGICGEHGGDPKSIAFCHRAGLSYVSCSPFRVAVARLAAAQAALR